MLDAPLYDGPRAQTTLERRHQIHGLLEKGVGLECTRRPPLALNAVKRYARADRPERMLCVPKYRASLVDPYREYLRKRRAEDPAVPVKHLFEEIKALGFTGCLNLPAQVHQPGPRGRWPQPHLPAPARPDDPHQARQPKAEHRELLARITAACPEMTQLAAVVGGASPNS